MIVYPAVDLMEGRCVRLAQGRFDDATVYSDDPADALARFADAGASWVHMVDLDGAKAGRPVQHDLLARLTARAPVKLQVAGGFRDAASVAAALEAGASRVVIGSLAVRDPNAVRAIIADHGGDRVVLALDVHIVGGMPMVATAGWTQTSGRTLYDIASEYADGRHLLVTDISRDGMMLGPNLPLVREAAGRVRRMGLQASGGVASTADIVALAQAGAGGVVIGKALWEGRIDLAEAISLAGA
ncbi:1-(5-phosphoribosyl)-5-[(5-phosphoribosylamino)methylideneamino] imidazole-4-carboxamide isomerase [Sphingosinicella sp. LHD-64]|uniref:1-(5-phosphoribosyl)-5-[(5- phosphoribosylamino)methylideneamino]imidazole-4- carboxamide isomerase n=1 Tax=Sphingosinicella sp. LHD-64 TaxID=3072139 RepID=UPI00280EE7CA|nr:1-(5-phosphoribosyl)-5-[(5-phosphoribosylamino)methylideneamino] imidazole-4-carboxamide isomerase [Sphingosinicella sp. LHD-64]MDQ8755581.1 1-(5-phosphoribosyl)-5-[(5-phosphoribosylamino)methylideneamino] imidazole-4-carboxamide isomerase [Sphingosinicella sp. LHD-64]